MNMHSMNAQTLTEQLGVEIPEILVVICKNDVAGLGAEDIARLTGFQVTEIQEMQQSSEYKDCRLLLGAASASAQVETDGGWDSIEQAALRKLEKEVTLSRDPDFLLKAAAVANKAQRRLRNQDQVLDPSKGAAIVPLKLTERLIERLNTSGDLTRIREREISVVNGTAKNPSFAKIDQALGVKTPQEQIQERRGGEELDWGDFGLEPPEA